MKKKTERAEKNAPAYLPGNFDADLILDSLGGIRSDERLSLKAGMYYVLDTLHQLSLNRKYQDQYEEEGGYPLNAKTLQKFVGNESYLTVLNLLIDHGVITRDDEYSPGVHSKLVRLTAKYNAAPIKIREFPRGNIRKRVMKYREQKESENNAALLVIPYITKWYDPSQLQMDRQKAHQFIEFYGSQMKKHIPSTLPRKEHTDVISRIDLRVNNMLLAMDKYYTGDLRLTKNGKDHRLHSVLSATKKELRSLFTYNGENLVSLDLKASQPYLLNCITDPEFYQGKGGKTLKALLPEISAEMKGIRNIRELNDILLMFPGSHTTHAGKGSQASSFSKISWGEDFYTHLVTKAATEGKSRIFPDRKMAKKRMMQILYNTESYADKDPGFLLFKEWFPAEAALISFFKKLSRAKKRKWHELQMKAKTVRKSPKIGKEYNVLNYLPVLLQRLESYLILEQVCKTISEEYPAAPMLTIHDCILTTASFATRVKAIIERELTNLTGLMPGISEDTPDNDIALWDLEALAKADMQEIFEKKTNGAVSQVGRKKPLAYEPPRFGDSIILSTRYLDPDVDRYEEYLDEDAAREEF